MLALTKTKNRREIVMATPSYRERIKAARAAAKAKREAEKAEWLREARLMAEVRHLSLEAVTASIRARGDESRCTRPLSYAPKRMR